MRIRRRCVEWKPWNWPTRTWIFVFIAAIVVSPFVTRWCYLWQVPDVRLPFDFEQSIGEEISDEVNAFRGYESAAQMLNSAEPGWLDPAVQAALSQIDPVWDDRLNQWLIDHNDLLATFERASAQERAVAVSWRKAHILMRLPLHVEFPKIVNLSRAEALRCERSNDFDKSWYWHRVCLRAGRHFEMNRFTTAVAMARRIRSDVYEGIARWASHPQVTIEHLRSVRAEVKADISSGVKFSDVLEAEYLMVENNLGRPDVADFLFPNWQSAPRYELPFSYWKRWTIWTMGEPEVSRRLVRQVLVNQLPQVDLSPNRRRPVVRTDCPTVYEVDPQAQRPPGQLTAAQLAVLLASPLGKRSVENDLFTDFGYRRPSGYDFAYAWRLDQTVNSLADVLLAAHEFHRTHDRFPAKLEDLVPEFIESVPIDEFTEERAPLRYRRDDDDEAVVWSVFYDGKDDGGEASATFLDVIRSFDNCKRCILYVICKQPTG